MAERCGKLFGCGMWEDIAAACPTPSDLIHFHESRMASLTALVLQSSQSISQIEKYMKSAEGQDEEMIEQTLLFDDLQRQVTSLQIQCLEERRNFLTLVGDNEQLKFQCEDLRRKFHAAMLLGRIDEKAVCHFLQKNPKAPDLTDQIIQITEEIKKCDGGKKTKFDLLNPGVLVQQVAFLEKHLEEFKQQSFAEAYSLKNTLKHADDERNLIKAHYESKLKEMGNRLHDARALMHKTTEENLKFQKKIIIAEENWTKQQKEFIIRLSEGSPFSNAAVVGSSSAGYNTNKPEKNIPALQKQLLEKLSRAEIQLLEKQNTVKEYEMKFLHMERKMQRIKDEEAETKRTYLDVVKKLQNRNSILEKRFDKIDERRKLDNEGFRQDVKAVRQFVTTIDKKLELFMHRKHQENFPPPSVGDNLIATRRVWCGDTAILKTKRGVLTGHNSENVKITSDVPPSSKSLVEYGVLDAAERDRLVYEMLSKVLRSAHSQVDKVEEGILASL